jgi:rhodanese-related sulfurtransferase
MGDFSISVDELKQLIGGPRAPVIFDVARRPAYDQRQRVLPTAKWREPVKVAEWAGEIPSGGTAVLYCMHGHNVSQLAAAELRRRGIDARILAGGFEAWEAAGGVTVLKSALIPRDSGEPSRWVTRIRPKIDRIACPWLIRRFIDRDAEFTFVEPPYVKAVAEELGAIPYDVEGVELSHRGETCSFDTLLSVFGLEDEVLRDLAMIIRGADTARLDLAPEAAGLLAVSFGISALSGPDDHAALERGFPVYDALYAWRRFAAQETHNWPARRP